MGDLLQLQSLPEITPVDQEGDQAAQVHAQEDPQAEQSEQLVLGEVLS
jgi:hypothetical protein